MRLQASEASDPDSKKPEDTNLSDGVKLTGSLRKPTVSCIIQEVRLSMKISEILTPEDLQTLTSSLADSPASRFPLLVSGRNREYQNRQKPSV